MTGWLGLVGGGEWSPACTVNEMIVEHAAGRPIVVLPTAAAYEMPDQMLAIAATCLRGLGATVTPCRALTKSDAHDEHHVAAVRAASVVYFTSGSAMHVRTMLKGTPLWDAVLTAWRSGTALIGSGGGAMAFADPMIDPRGGAYTLGLGVIEGIAVLTEADQWTEERRRRVMRMADANTVVAMISTGAALLHTSEGWSRHGTLELSRSGAAIAIDELAAPSVL